MVTDEGKDRNETWTLRKKMKLKQLYKVGSESKLNSGPDSSVGLRVCTEFNGRGFKSHTGQTSIATFKKLFSGEYHIYRESSYWKLAWVGFDSTTTEFRTSCFWSCSFLRNCTHALTLCVYIKDFFRFIKRALGTNAGSFI